MRHRHRLPNPHGLDIRVTFSAAVQRAPPGGISVSQNWRVIRQVRLRARWYCYFRRKV